MASDLMNTEPGGENTQYESIKTITEPHSKEVGQQAAKDFEPSAEPWQQQGEGARRGEKTAENVRSGQVSGKTTDTAGHSVEDASDLKAEAGEVTQSREAQGYGPGSGVGA